MNFINGIPFQQSKSIGMFNSFNMIVTLPGEEPVTARLNTNQLINIGKTHTNVQFRYETYTIEDEIEVYYQNDRVFTSTCIGTGGEKNASLFLSDDDTN